MAVVVIYLNSQTVPLFSEWKEKTETNSSCVIQAIVIFSLFGYVLLTIRLASDHCLTAYLSLIAGYKKNSTAQTNKTVFYLCMIWCVQLSEQQKVSW